MKANPFLKKLGLSETDKVVIFHADDIGMCEASVDAYQELVDFGLMSSAATMVPCSWFPATAVYCKDNPKVDMGIHLTLTSEWDGYRWRPMSTVDRGTGLFDEEGYFPRRQVNEDADATAVYNELKAQIEHGLARGIDATHMDTHMFAIFPRYIDSYLKLSQEYKIPAFVFQRTVEEYMNFGATEAQAKGLAQLANEHEENGMPLLDNVFAMSYVDASNRFEQAKAYLDNLEAGITYFLLHPSTDTAELRAIAPDWPIRVADYELFKDEKFRQYVKDLGIHVMGWRELKALI